MLSRNVPLIIFSILNVNPCLGMSKNTAQLFITAEWGGRVYLGFVEV